MPGNLPAIGDPTNGRGEIGVHASASWLAGEVQIGDGIAALVSGGGGAEAQRVGAAVHDPRNASDTRPKPPSQGENRS
jgi:hypothetical protein